MCVVIIKTMSSAGDKYLQYSDGFDWLKCKLLKKRNKINVNAGMLLHI